MNNPSSGTPSGNSISPCVLSQSIIVILVPFSNLNRTIAVGIFCRLVIGLLTTTSMGVPTLSLQVNHIVTLEKSKNCSQEVNHVGVQVTVMLVCLVITNAQVILSHPVTQVLIIQICK